MRRVGERLGITPETLRNWVTQAEVDAGERVGITADEAFRVTELEREGRELRRVNEISKTAPASLGGGARPPTAPIVDSIDARRHLHGVEPICRVLTEDVTQIAPTTYYAAKTRPPSAREVSDAETTTVIERIRRRQL